MTGKKNKSAAKKVNILPNEIEENIISRLPVKTILRFMSVCKSWYFLFSSPYFIEFHSKNNLNSNNLHLMSLRKSNNLVVMGSSSSPISFFVDPQLDNGTRDSFERSIVGCYNGIVCVHGICRRCNFDGTFNYYLCLWNPALNFVKVIKKGFGYHQNKKLIGQVYLGFGFHNNDCKVLRFQKPIATHVEIYSLSSGSWRIVNVLPHSDYFKHRYFSRGLHTHSSIGVYINGAHHWAIVDVDFDSGFSLSSAIISFDMREEEFKDIIIPSECVESHLILFNYNELLAMLTGGSTKYSLCIWVMKDYGVPGSWTKLCKIDQQLGRWVNLRGIFHINNKVIIPRHIYGAEEGLIVFYIDKSEVKETKIEFLKDLMQVQSYRESLLLLDSFNKLKA